MCGTLIKGNGNIIVRLIVALLNLPFNIIQAIEIKFILFGDTDTFLERADDKRMLIICIAFWQILFSLPLFLFKLAFYGQGFEDDEFPGLDILFLICVGFKMFYNVINIVFRLK